MNLGISFFVNSALLGVGLAMDAFSVSLANGLNEPGMKKKRMCLIAGIFAFFQAVMPLAGWICVHTIVEHFKAFEKLIPWIALILLGYIGGKMLFEGIKNMNIGACPVGGVSFGTLIVQGIATSIDALSVGFAIASYGLYDALLAAFIISVVTFVICLAGVIIGRQAGTKMSGRAGILGGVILIIIGIEIFVSSII